MGLKDIMSRFRKSKTQEIYSVAGTPNRVITARDVYDSDTVQQAISRCVGEVKKYHLTHVKIKKGEEFAVDDSLQRVLDRPNDWQTQSDLLEMVTYQLYLHANAYVIPEFYETQTGARVYTGLYCVQPQIVERVEDDEGNAGYFFKFASGFEICLPVEDVIHIKRQYAKNPYFGGDEYGRPDSKALKATVGLNDDLLDGVIKGVKSGYSVNGVIKLSSVASKDIQKERYKAFMDKIKNGESGFIVMDKTSDFQPIQQGTQAHVDPETLNFINRKIIRSFGVSQEILDGNATSEQYRTFLQIAIDPIIRSITDELTKKLFTSQEVNAYGHRIRMYQDTLRYVDTTTLSSLQMLADIGAIYMNELRNAVGLRSLSELSGQRIMSKNWGSADAVKDQVLVESGYAPQSEPIKEDETQTKKTETGIDSEAGDEVKE